MCEDEEERKRDISLGTGDGNSYLSMPLPGFVEGLRNNALTKKVLLRLDIEMSRNDESHPQIRERVIF